MIRKVAALVLGVAVAFGAGAYAGTDAQDPAPKASCCQHAQDGHDGEAKACCKDGECAKECGECAKGECKTCPSAECCKGKECKNGKCAHGHDAAKPGGCCTRH